MHKGNLILSTQYPLSTCEVLIIGALQMQFHPHKFKWDANFGALPGWVGVILCHIL